MLLRKVERLDSMKPWQPFGNEEGATFYPYLGRDNRNYFYLSQVAFSILIYIKIENFATTSQTQKSSVSIRKNP